MAEVIVLAFGDTEEARGRVRGLLRSGSVEELRIAMVEPDWGIVGYLRAARPGPRGGRSS